MNTPLTQLAKTARKAIKDAALERRLHMVLNQAGWQLDVVEINTVRQTIRIVVSSSTRRVICDVEPHQGMITTESLQAGSAPLGRRGEPSRWTTWELLGRYRCPGGLATLRWLTTYLASNAPLQLTRHDARSTFAFLTHVVRR